MAEDYSAIYPLLEHWDIHQGGIPPTSKEIEAAHRCGYQPGANHTLALALGFRNSGSTRLERRYAGNGDPKDNVGALGDLMREQQGSAKNIPDRSITLTTKTGARVRAVAYGRGQWKFELIDDEDIEREQPRERYRKRLKECTRTEKEAMVKRRIGQETLRDCLLERDQKCVLTGLDVPELLRASHIRPWSDSNQKDRLNPDNALLLAAHIDAAFDSHLISFDEDGRVIFSKALSKMAKRLLGLTSKTKLRNHSRHEAFMSEHRAKLKPGTSRA